MSGTYYGDRTASSEMSELLPFVSVVVPVLNEERYVADCLRAILAQDYPPDCMEILVIDGLSTDRTRSIVLELAAGDNRIHLLSNPERRIPHSLNQGITTARGEVVVRIDGHSVVSSYHVRRCVEFLQASGAEHIGGVLRARGRTYIARTIALAMSSPFGVGTARFRYTEREQDIDTVPFGAYHRETLLRLGGFDQRFLIGEDPELDYRITLIGGRIRVTPTIVTDYYCRDSLRGLALQYFRYGRAKAFILHKHGTLPSPRALFPAGLLSLIVLLMATAPVIPLARRALSTLLSVYVTGCAVAGCIVGLRHGLRYSVLLPFTFITLHLSHGVGFVSSLPLLLSPRPVDRLHGSLPPMRELTPHED